MCGIAGIYNLDNAPANEASLKIMAEIQAHRGPDDFGLWLDNSIGFSHRRLSIIDLSEYAHQPMISADGNLILVYNGEIYNYLEIKEELKAKGYNFHSNSDSEVLLYSFQEWGINCVSKFNGMWAFAIYNKKEEMLFCSRDRFGVKPFYYFYNKKSFTFSSEIKALIAILPELRQVNYTYLYYFLSTSSLDDGEETFFKNIKTLKPAHNLLIKKDQFKIWKYWDYEESFKSKYDYNHPEDSFLNLLKSSVQFRLRSDVPVGTCLSGGLDSSSIVTLMYKFFRIKAHTFSSMYEDKDCD
ncbi:MAG: asparagine synthase (glutamine-hydrolyzing), partial [Armatimonadetes bacterium]|nr:asparagine synthase (glutamine-hydrolyzing) [Armatimonadota bacterium]